MIESSRMAPVEGGKKRGGRLASRCARINRGTRTPGRRTIRNPEAPGPDISVCRLIEERAGKREINGRQRLLDSKIG